MYDETLDISNYPVNSEIDDGQQHQHRYEQQRGDGVDLRADPLFGHGVDDHGQGLGLAAGGEVTGVEPEFFIQDEFQHVGLTKLIVTKDMPERKSKMIELGDAFLAFPGGTGTLEEITEVMSKVSLKHLNAPCILYNLNGYYNDLKALLDHMIEKGLSSRERQEGIYFAANLEEIKRILEAG